MLSGHLCWFHAARLAALGRRTVDTVVRRKRVKGGEMRTSINTLFAVCTRAESSTETVQQCLLALSTADVDYAHLRSGAPSATDAHVPYTAQDGLCYDDLDSRDNLQA